MDEAPWLRGFPAPEGEVEGSGGVSLPALPDPFPRFEFGAVVDSSPVLLGVIWVVLVLSGMVAMPGRHRTRGWNQFEPSASPPGAGPGR